MSGLAGDPAAGLDPADDVVQPFQIEGCGVRGRLARLGAVADEVLGRHAYPEPVKALLGESLALAAVLAGALKYEGIFTLQIQSDGPVGMIVADVTSAGAVRGYAGYDAERVAAVPDEAESAPVPHLLGKGYLAFTVDQGPETDRYQGIVELTGANLAQSVEQYFRQSEQIEAAVDVAAGRIGRNGNGGGAWRSAAIMIQRVPEEGGHGALAIETVEEREERWRRAHVLMASVRPHELTDPRLTPETLLLRLFHQEGVRVFEPRALHRACRCSRERVARTLAGIPREGLADLTVDGVVEVTCQFCNERYIFGETDIDALFGE